MFNVYGGFMAIKVNIQKPKFLDELEEVEDITEEIIEADKIQNKIVENIAIENMISKGITIVHHLEILTY